jgi:hypothetical protein
MQECSMCICFLFGICMIQAERVEIRLCKVYAELMCYGTGTIWVSHFFKFYEID